MMVAYKYNWLMIIEYVATALLLGNVSLTALNIFPANLWVGLFGSLGWLVLSCLWRKISLMVINGLFAAIYFYGLVAHYIH